MEATEYKEKGGSEKERGNMGEEENKNAFTQDDVDKAVKAATEKAIKETQDTAKADADKELKAALEKKEMFTKADADEMVKAALEKAEEGDNKEKEQETYTKDELDAKIKASVEQATEQTTEQTKDDIERGHLAASINDALVNAGIIEETDREKQTETLKAASSEILQQMLENITAVTRKLDETVKAAADGKDIQFPADTTSSGSGAYEWNPVKGEFTEVKQ